MSRSLSFVFVVYYLLLIYGNKYLKRIPNLGAACSSHAGGTISSSTLPRMMISQKVKNDLCVHGSIAHHERKIKYLRSLKSVHPEVSKGEPDFLRVHQE
jgi:hypothetical protein